MAERSSGSDSEPNLTDWTVVDGQGDVEGSDSSSTSSSLEFVQLEENAAIFQKKDPSRVESLSVNGDEEEAVQDGDKRENLERQEKSSIDACYVENVGTVQDDRDSEQTVACEGEEEAVCMSLEDDINAEDEDLNTSQHDESSSITDYIDQENGEEIVGNYEEGEPAVQEVASGSDSDSDFIKLEAGAESRPGCSTSGLGLPEAGPPALPAADVMEASTSSTRSTSSSISTSFRFVHPLLPHPSYHNYREATDEEDSIPGDVDDRCESDISGIAEDDSLDSDMSSFNNCLGDVPLIPGRRLYKHSPNPSLNAVLTAISMAALFLALGVGIGNFIGVSRESALRREQVTKMKIAQDNHLMCLKHASIVRDRLNKLKDAARLAGGDQIADQELRTCGDVWRNKYENVMVQNSKLELRVQELEARDISQTEFQPVGELLKSGIYVQDYVMSLREDLNKAELENVDLRREVSKLRYTAHPANALKDNGPSELDMKLKLNHLVTENTDLKSVVGKMRYSPYPLTDESSETDPDVVVCALDALENKELSVNITGLKATLDETVRELAAERNLSMMLRMALSKRVNESTSADDNDKSSAWMKCYKLLGPEIINKTTEYIDKATVGAASYVSMIQNSTIHNKRRLVMKMQEIIKSLDNEKTDTIKDQFGKLKAEVADFLGVLLKNANISLVVESNETMRKTASFLKNMSKPVTKHFEHYMNKTKHSVSKLSNKVQETWQVVKNLSNKFIERSSEKVKAVTEDVAQKAEGLKKRVEDKWGDIKGKWEKNGWFKKEQTLHPLPHDNIKQLKKTKYNNRNKHTHGNDKNEYKYESPHSTNHFEDKPHHKQRQSNHEQYNEFWRKADFDPDDYFHEGFFEGNQREWQKHQDRLRHLHNRIHRLNEDILYSMDDDDIEDIYEDLDDLQDDIEDEDQPQSLQTWLACQVRWWKSRLQRKHRSQDLVKGCGRQIMQWQLRALCKDECVGKRCGKKKKVPTATLR